MMYDESGNPVHDDPWSSIVDLMSALVLVLFLAVIFFITNYSEVTEELKIEKSLLAVQQKQLAQTQDNFSHLSAEFKVLELERKNLEVKANILEKEGIQLKNNQLALISDKNKLIADRDHLAADKEKLIADRDHLAADKDRLIADRDQLAADKNKLIADRDQLATDKDNLIADRDQLATDKDNLTKEKDLLKKERNALIEAQKRLELTRQKLLGDKEKLIGNQDRLQSKTQTLNALVIDLQSKIKSLQERQTNLMDSLSSAFSDANTQGVKVDREEGKIIMKSEILFKKGKAELTAKGKESLRGVAQALNRVIFKDQFKSLVEGVMIEGHTSSTGDQFKNLNLSSERALNSLKHLLSLREIKSHQKSYKKLLFAGAFGESRPIIRKGKESPILSRRIEIRILFNQKQLQSLTNDLTKLK